VLKRTVANVVVVENWINPINSGATGIIVDC
jgi:hypothetical protein